MTDNHVRRLFDPHVSTNAAIVTIFQKEQDVDIVARRVSYDGNETRAMVSS